MALTQPDLRGRRSEKGPPGRPGSAIQAARVRYVCAVAVAIGLAAAVLWFVRDVFLLLFAGILLAGPESLGAGKVSYITAFCFVLGAAVLAGIALATPLTAVMMVLTARLYVEGVGDRGGTSL